MRPTCSCSRTRQDAARAVRPAFKCSIVRRCELAKRRGIPVRAYSRAKVVDFFEEFGAKTKQSIAETIAKHIPALSLYVPPPRKPWKSEDARMGIFEAAALAWTFSQSSGDAAPF